MDVLQDLQAILDPLPNAVAVRLDVFVPLMDMDGLQQLKLPCRQDCRAAAEPHALHWQEDMGTFFF